MPIIRDRDIFMNAVRVLSTISTHLPFLDTSKAIETLSNIVSSEDFSTYKREYVRSEDEVLLLIHLKENCVSKFAAGDFKSRRIARPLNDCIANFMRQFGLK